MSWRPGTWRLKGVLIAMMKYVGRMEIHCLHDIERSFYCQIGKQPVVHYIAMCGRFAQSQPLIHYAHAFDPAWEPTFLDLQPTWNLAPGRRALVFHETNFGKSAELLQWGFLPAWADPTGQKPINARVETAASKPYFRKAWKAGRCLIPADGWYEWLGAAKNKQPYFIHRSDNQPILMAGLYETNTHANITSFAILTTEADGALPDVHDRKPLVLSAETGKQWIRRDLAANEIAALAQSPLTAERFAWHVVSTKVNNTRNDGAELVSQL
jgi:putative SOS response-associated peptidase YedK